MMTKMFLHPSFEKKKIRQERVSCADTEPSNTVLGQIRPRTPDSHSFLNSFVQTHPLRAQGRMPLPDQVLLPRPQRSRLWSPLHLCCLEDRRPRLETKSIALCSSLKNPSKYLSVAKL